MNLTLWTEKWLLLKNTNSGSDFATSCLLLKRKNFYETKKTAYLGCFWNFEFKNGTVYRFGQPVKDTKPSPTELIEHHTHINTDIRLKLAYFAQGKLPESAKIFTREFPFWILR
jgi:hypothetical protein